jgi:hypothetical protein
MNILFNLLYVLIILKILTYFLKNISVNNFKVSHTIPKIEGNKFNTILKLKNINTKVDLFILDLFIKSTLCRCRNKDVTCNISWKSNFHKDYNYWDTQVLLPYEEIKIEIEGEISDITQAGNSLSLDIDYITYGQDQNHQINKYYQIVIPLESKELIKSKQENILWKSIDSNSKLLSLKTPILTNTDTLENIINDYVKDHYQKGDILCIAESALAIIQNRYVHYSELKISLWAKILSKFPNHLSSLATPGGIQSLIDLVGLHRVVFAGIISGVFKLFNKNGWFYRICGTQSKLIDDVSGTLPPYDKHIVLGPNNLKSLVNNIYQKTNVKLAIVDVNDIKKVDILECYSSCDTDFIKKMLRDNPSGNSDEQTPLTLIRQI